MRKYLEPGEDVRLDDRPHAVALVRPFFRASLFAAIGIALAYFGRTELWALAPGTIAFALAAWVAVRSVLAWDRTRLVVTSRKLLVVHGVLRRRTAAAELPPGGAVEIDQSLVGRMLGYGTVIAGNLEVPYVPDPGRLH
jgi:uncharacterized membrane protein YdbT with pleckstrin-like domain